MKTIRVSSVLEADGLLKIQDNTTNEWIESVVNTPENRQAIIAAMAMSAAGGCHRFGEREYHFTPNTKILPNSAAWSA